MLPYIFTREIEELNSGLPGEHLTLRTGHETGSSGLEVAGQRFRLIM